MAAGIFYLRPSADISLGHPIYPETLTAGYLAINEEVSDGDATYIGIPVNNSESSLDYTSIFRMTFQGQQKIKGVLDAYLIFDGFVDGYYSEGDSRDAYCTCTVVFQGEEVFSGTKKYNGGSDTNTDTLTNARMSDLASALTRYLRANDTTTLPDVQITINNYCDSKGSKSDVGSYTSQVAIQLVCEYFGVYHKNDGAWIQAESAYQKQNGAWVEITEDECNSILSSDNLVRMP